MKTNIKNKYSNFLIKMIFLLLLIDICSNYCDDISKPILLSGDNTCVMKYCSEEEFKNKICIKNNNIIRNQWLNNIITFGDKNSTFSKIAKYTSGDIVAVSNNKFGYDGISYFYGLKENGRPLFVKENKENPYKSLIFDGQLFYYELKNDEGEILVIKIESSNKEYIINIQREYLYMELYDFEDEYIHYVVSYFIFSSDEEVYSIYSYRGSLFNIKDSNYFMYAGIFVKYIDEKEYYFLLLFILSLSKKEIINYYSEYQELINIRSEEIVGYGYMTSCFQTEDGEYIFCFYIHSLNEKKYKIIIFDKELQKLEPELSIISNVLDENKFFKCIYYEGYKGIFVYYKKIDDNGPFPVILFRRKVDEEIIEWENLDNITIKSYIFNTDLNLNDVIKLSNNYIYFASVSTDKEILYIVTLNIFDDQSKVKIRYYIIRIFGLYQYKFYSSLRLNNYKQFITLSSSYCNQAICEDDNDYYSSLIIFSYPNSTDVSKNIIDKLFEKNEIIYYLSLRNNVIIENNIFGLIYSKIKIKTIENCNTINLISSTKNSEIIVDYELENDEDISITFVDNYNLFNCTIGYIYEITEPNYTIFEEYAENKDTDNGDDNEQIFNEQKTEYSGRLSYYNIYLKDVLTNDCSDNCILCYDDSVKLCIVCNYNYTVNDIDGEKQKTCLEKENEGTEVLTELYSDNTTEKVINNETDQYIDESSNKITDLLTEEETDIITDKITEEQTDIETETEKQTDIITDKITQDQTGIITEITDKITEKETDIITDKIIEEQTDIITDKLTENKTEIITEITDKLTENQTDKETDKMTEEKTDIGTDKMEEEQADIDTDKLEEEQTDIGTDKMEEEQADIETDKLEEEQTDIGTDKLEEAKTDIETDKLEEEQTDIRTDKLEETKTDIRTDKLEETQTDILTNKLADKPKDITIDKPIDKKECTNEEILATQCQNAIVKDEQFSDLNNQIKEDFLNKYDGEEKRIDTENVKFQMKNYSSNDDDYDSSISSINLGKCEEALKKQYNIPKDEHLIIYKIDIQSDDLFTTYVQYKIYNPLNLQPLDNLTVCSKETISISVPVNLNNDTKALYNSLNNSGYNLFDVNDSFYNDICATYTTQNGTDIILNDRKGLIEESGGSLDFCQEGCTMEYFNYTIQKAKCNCDIDETKTITNLKDIKFTKDLFLNLVEGVKYSNYLVMKCYKLLIDFELIKSNIGLIFMTIIVISKIIFFFIYIIKGSAKINYYIQSILKKKSDCNNDGKNMNKDNNKKSNKNLLKMRKEKNKDKLNNVIYNDKNIKQLKKPKTIIKMKEKNRKIIEKKNTDEPPPKKNKIRRNNHHESNASLKSISKTNEILKNNHINNLNINIIPIHNINNQKSIKMKIGKSKSTKNANFTKISKKNVNIYKIKNENISDDKQELKKNEKLKKNKDLDYINYKTLNIQELNTLDYQKALLIDKRSFIEYYCDLMRKKHLLIFTFVPINDYNLTSLKISSFILQFSLYLTVNAFFFTDSTMNQLYRNNGENYLLYHLSQIIYSSLISLVINVILRQLSLSENHILSIKVIKDIKLSTRKSNEVKTILKIKFIIFFVISFILAIFLWYFVSCFCAVYTNTQIILIKDTLISFCLSMIYPFGIYLIPGIFRIHALRAKNQDKKCLYKISQLLTLI